MRVWLAIIIFISSHAMASEWNVDDVLVKLKSNEADKFVSSILVRGDWEIFDNFLEQTKTGTNKWLEVAQLLRRHTDAGASMALSITLAQAIKNNPEEVLSIMNITDIKWSCSVPLIEPTKTEYHTFIDTTISAVTKVSDKALLNKKHLCLKELKTAKEYSSKVQWSPAN